VKAQAVALALGVLCASAATADDPSQWRPSQALVARIDAHLFVPAKDGGPRQNYDRYYAGAVQDGRRVVLIELDNFDPGPRTVHIVSPSQIPRIADGGCEVITGAYDVAAHRLSDLVCNFALPVPPPAKLRG
jgi:hypothetical protein